MAKCEFCDKGVTFGIKVSHSHRRSNRPWKPNVKPPWAATPSDRGQLGEGESKGGIYPLF